MITLTKSSVDMAKRMQITEYYCHIMRKTEGIWRNGQKGMLMKGEIAGIKKQRGMNRRERQMYVLKREGNDRNRRKRESGN